MLWWAWVGRSGSGWGSGGPGVGFRLWAFGPGVDEVGIVGSGSGVGGLAGVVRWLDQCLEGVVGRALGPHGSGFVGVVGVVVPGG